MHLSCLLDVDAKHLEGLSIKSPERRRLAWDDVDVVLGKGGLQFLLAPRCDLGIQHGDAVPCLIRGGGIVPAVL